MSNTTENSCIFFLDNDPALAARALFDDDLKATILYLAIVVSQAVKELAPDVDWKKEGYTIYQHDLEPPYEHDVSWLQSTPSVWKWVGEYFRAMLAEYEYRFESKHPSHEIAYLFEADTELDEGGVDEFMPPSIAAIEEKYHVDANFRTAKMVQEKDKGKTIFKVSVLNSYRNLYRTKWNDEDHNGTYSNRHLPAFMTSPAVAATPQTPVRRAPQWAPARQRT